MECTCKKAKEKCTACLTWVGLQKTFYAQEAQRIIKAHPEVVLEFINQK